MSILKLWRAEADDGGSRSTIVFFNGQAMPVRDILMDFMLLHDIHSRGQLSLMCREAGGQPTSLFGSTRETMPLTKKG